MKKAMFIILLRRAPSSGWNLRVVKWAPVNNPNKVGVARSPKEPQK